MDPLLLERAAGGLDQVALEPHHDDPVVLRDELAGFELLELESLPQQGKELAYPIAPVTSTGERDGGWALIDSLHVLGEEL
jgi:hypothetical protein